MATLIATNKVFTDKLATALDTSVELTKMLTEFKGEGSGGTGNRHYCWTHGCRCNHNSRACRFKADGHKDNATATNKLGGTTKNFKYATSA